MGRTRPTFAMPKLICTLLAALLVAVESVPFTRTYILTPQTHQSVPVFKTYYQPLRFFNPQYNFDFTSPVYQPQLPPFFSGQKPSNEATEKPSDVTTTSAPDSTEQPPKIDLNDTSLFDHLFKKAFVPTSFDLSSSQEFYFPETPIFNPLETKVVIPPTQFYDSFPSDPWKEAINSAYGLNGFRPYYYDQFLRSLNNTNCTEEHKYEELLTKSSQPDEKTLEKENKIKADIMKILTKVSKPDSDIVVFNTEEPLFKSDEHLDVRNKEKFEMDQSNSGRVFYDTYKDIMFLNKSFFTTIAPYLH